MTMKPSEGKEYIVRTKIGALMLHLRMNAKEFCEVTGIYPELLHLYTNKESIPSASLWLKMKQCIEEKMGIEVGDDPIDERISLEDYIKSLGDIKTITRGRLLKEKKAGKISAERRKLSIKDAEWVLTHNRSHKVNEEVEHLVRFRQPQVLPTQRGAYRIKRVVSGGEPRGGEYEDREDEVMSPLQAVRKLLNLSRGALADQLRVEVWTITGIEQGLRIMDVPLAKEVQEVARKHGIAVTLDELYQNVEAR